MSTGHVEPTETFFEFRVHISVNYNLPDAGFLKVFDANWDAVSPAYRLDMHLRVISGQRRAWRRVIVEEAANLLCWAKLAEVGGCSNSPPGELRFTKYWVSKTGNS